MYTASVFLSHVSDHHLDCLVIVDFCGLERLSAAGRVSCLDECQCIVIPGTDRCERQVVSESYLALLREYPG